MAASDRPAGTSVVPRGETLARGFNPNKAFAVPLFRASDVFELRYGRALVETGRRPGAVPVFGTNGQCGWHDTPLFGGPGVILGRKGQGPLGVEWVDRDYWVIDTAYSLRLLRDDVDLRYSYYLVKYVGLNHLKDGTSNPSLSRDTFGAQVFPLPPLAQQRSIAGILSTLDAKIELNRRMNETLEGIARAIFKSWFIDFDPVRAKSEGRQPTGMKGNAAGLFPDRFEESMLGHVPEGWKAKPFTDTVEVLGGGTPKTSMPGYWGGMIPWFSVVDAPENSDVFVIDTEKKITDAGLRGSAAKLLPEGTTIVTARGTVGKVALVGVAMAMNQSCYGLRGSGPAHTYFATRALLGTLTQRSHGSVFGTITTDTLRGILVVTPPRATVDLFEARVSSILERIKNNLEQARILADLRDLLLPKLLSGDLTVGGAEHADETSAWS